MVLTHFIIALKITLAIFLAYRIQRFLRVHRSWELCALLAFLVLSVVFIWNHPSGMEGHPWLPITILSVVLLSALEPELASLISKVTERLNPNALNKKNNVISEISKAASALAATKTGALIAFERKDSLLKFGGTGIEINADIKSELLATLFVKDTPTHDGGLLIRHGRATHCGAVFPLTEQRQIENGLGTRHRAALGLTEKTDAVCLVVSEEEGTISLAKNGELLYAIPPAEVEGQLKNALSREEGARFYPLHYLKRYAPKLAGPNFIIFSKSFTKKCYEAVVVLFWLTVAFLFGAHRILGEADPADLITILLTDPWAYIPIVLFAVNLATLFLSQRLTVDGVTKEIKKENRFFFLPLPGRKWVAYNLKAVVVRREGPIRNLTTLGLYTRKQKTVVLDRGTSEKIFAEYAKKIHDILRIELVT